VGWNQSCEHVAFSLVNVILKCGVPQDARVLLQRVTYKTAAVEGPAYCEVPRQPDFLCLQGANSGLRKNPEATSCHKTVVHQGKRCQSG
jgi:hypothetical protein